jgi:hypothetical protein
MLFQRVPNGQRAVDPEALGLRSKLGGDPDWEQEPEWPSCPECGGQMAFVGQIDSIEHDEEANAHRIDAVHGDQHFMFGDVGMLYIFICWNCNETKAVMQCG